MNCHSFINVLDLYLEKRLSPRRMKAAEKHIAQCLDCRTVAGPRAPAAAVRAPETLKARLLSAAKASANPNLESGRISLWPREARAIAVAAAGLMILAGIIQIVGMPSQNNPPSLAALEEP